MLNPSCGNLVIILLASFSSAVQALDVDEPCVLSVLSSNDNVIARHLAGNWTYNKQVTEHLTKNRNPGRAEEEDKTPLEDIILTFSNDPDVLKDVPSDHCRSNESFSHFYVSTSAIINVFRFLKANKMEVFMAGLFRIAHVEYGITQHVFVLISSQGVPGIIYWRGEEAVTNYLLMAPAAQTGNDLLFLGEDSATKPFSALHRIGSENICK